MPKTTPSVAAPHSVIADRTHRMGAMLIALGLLGLIDLGLTWATMAGGGLFEGNDVPAALVAALPSAATLIIFKLALTGFGVGVFWGLRRHRCAHWGAALCVVIYVCVAAQWMRYVREINRSFTGGMNSPQLVVIPSKAK
jgi:hypothetical protein